MSTFIIILKLLREIITKKIYIIHDFMLGLIKSSCNDSNSLCFDLTWYFVLKSKNQVYPQPKIPIVHAATVNHLQATLVLTGIRTNYTIVDAMA